MRVVVLDGLHWAEPASLGLLGHVARIVSAVPMLLIGAYRETEIELTHPLASTVTGWTCPSRSSNRRVGHE